MLASKQASGLRRPVLAAFAAEPAHRLFLADLLTSYARRVLTLAADRYLFPIAEGT